MATKKTRREFTDEFKREAVVLLRNSGRPLTQVASELGLEPSVLRRWRSLANGAGQAVSAVRPGGAAVAASAEQLEIRRLQKEVERAQMERDIQKKQSASSRARRDEAPFHRGPPRSVPRAGDVIGAAGQRQRLLCPANLSVRRLALPPRERPRPSEQGAGRGPPTCPRQQPAPLRQPAGTCVPTSPRKPEGFAAGASGWGATAWRGSCACMASRPVGGGRSARPRTATMPSRLPPTCWTGSSRPRPRRTRSGRSKGFARAG